MPQYKLDMLVVLLNRTRNLLGVVVEMGVFQGDTLRLLALHAEPKMCYGFDTFAGFPQEQWVAGDPTYPPFNQTTYADVARRMPHNVVLRAGAFPHSLLPEDDKLCVAFAHVDFDWYEGMLAAINWLGPRMVQGGIMVFDDWNKGMCPGVMRALDDAQLPVTQATKHQAYWTNR